MKKIKGVSNIEYLAKGSRGVVYTGRYKGRKVAVKMKNPDSEAKKRIQNEIIFLKIVNAYGVGPKLLLEGRGYFVYEFQEGVYFEDWIREHMCIKKVFNALLRQARVLDLLGIDKEEFHRPLKNVIIKKGGVPVLIDFERCRYSERPKNVTQLMQFAMALGLAKLNKRAIGILRKYKGDMSEKNFGRVVSLLR
jgi:putative serine/threonine protein kinase